MIVEEVWRNSNTNGPGPGLVRRRVREESARNLFVGVQHPDLIRTLILAVDEAAASQIVELPTTRGSLRISRRLKMGWSRFGCRCLAPGDGESVQSVRRRRCRRGRGDQIRRRCGPVFMTRFSHWRRLLAGVDAEGLGRHAAQGLYGELWTLRHLLVGPLSEHTALAAWHGPDRLDRDFRSRRPAIEVKTTGRDNPLSVAIAGEQQLDHALFSRLFLVALAIDALPAGGGETLNEMVDGLLADLAPEDARLLLRDKLLEYGYAAAHRRVRRCPRYSLRELAIFEVAPGFPRIVEADVLAGVGEVRYLLSLPACAPWRSSSEDLQRALRAAA